LRPTALLDRPESKGYARRTRDTKDRRRALVRGLARILRERAEELYGSPEEGADELAIYSDKELEFLIAFLRGTIAYQEERVRRLEAIKAREADVGGSAG